MRIILALLLFTMPLPAQRVQLDARAEQSVVSLTTARMPDVVDPARAALWPLLQWRNAKPGLDWSEVELWAGSLRTPLRVIVARVDPRSVDMRLVLRTRENGMSAAWNVDSAAADVAFAVNAGQFKETGPWGWLMMNGAELRAPGFGPLSAAVAIDTSGALRWLLPAQMRYARQDHSIRDAFQSYPLLIFDHRVPAMLMRSADVSRTHRDARLLLLQRDDGIVLVVLTRYDALGVFAQRVPIGLTVPESAVLAASLGARYALMLDGGISAQMLVRSSSEGTLVWKGLRDVPLALVGRLKPR